MTVWAVAMLAAGALTLFRARRFYSEVMAKALGRAVLGVWGIRVVVRQEEPFPRTQTVYISNHPSTLDPFVLIALGLPRTRFFMRGGLRKFVPLAVIGHVMGIFWTVEQQYPERRMRIFQRADRILCRTGESVYLSPEGMRVTTSEIGHFNKGAFHLATSLGAPIVPMYLEIPPETNPGKGYATRAGTVTVHVLPAIPTAAWRVEGVERNAAAVRDQFVRVHAERRGGAPLVEAT